MLKKTLICLAIMSIIAFGGGRRPAAIFLSIWPGSRPTALGGCFTAIADDASAAYYNQGGLGFIEGIEIMGNHVPWLPGLWEDMYYNYLSIAVPAGNKGVAAFHNIYLNTGKTRVINREGVELGYYITYDISPGVAYGYKINDKLGVGGGIKLIYSFLAPRWVWEKMPELGISEGGTGISWALDGGILYKPFKSLNIGIALQNLGPSISFIKGGEPDPLPLMLRTAFKWEPLNTPLFKLILTGDLTKILVGMFAIDSIEVDGRWKRDLTIWDKLSYEIKDIWRGFGLEFGYYNMLFVRIGYFYDWTGSRGGIFIKENGTKYQIDILDYITGNYEGEYEGIGFTYGIGIKLGGFKLDIGIDEKIYHFTTENRKFSIAYSF